MKKKIIINVLVRRIKPLEIIVNIDLKLLVKCITNQNINK